MNVLINRTVNYCINELKTYIFHTKHSQMNVSAFISIPDCDFPIISLFWLRWVSVAGVKCRDSERRKVRPHVGLQLIEHPYFPPETN